MKKRWSDQDTQYLISNYGKEKIDDIAVKLIRSYDAVQWRAAKLGLTQEEKY